MKLYIGGAYQGQEEIARRENPDAEIFAGFHETIRAALARREDPIALARRMIEEHPDAVIVADEIGCGIVPMLREERAWREAVGRAMGVLAQAAESVTRVSCGIGVRIK